MEKGKAKKTPFLLLLTQTVEEEKDCAVVAHIDCREGEAEKKKKDCAVVAHTDCREREEEKKTVLLLQT